MLAPSAIRCLRLLKTPELLLKVSTPGDWASAHRRHTGKCRAKVAAQANSAGREGTGTVTADRYVPSKQERRIGRALAGAGGLPPGFVLAEATARGGPVQALTALRDQGVLAHLGVAGGPVRLIREFIPFSVRDPQVAATVVGMSEPSPIGETCCHPSLRVCGIAMLTTRSRAHYDYAVWPGRRSAQAAPLALTRPKGA